MLQKVKIGTEEISVNECRLYRGVWGWIDAGIWEPTTLGIILGAARGGVFIDIGAWIGPTALAGALVAEKVICYEPDPVAAKELRLNIQLNGFDNIELHEVALCGHDGTVPFGPGDNDALGLSTSSTVVGNLDTLVAARDAREEAKKEIYQQCTLMKMDIEGGEYELVVRLAGYLKKRRPTLLLSLHSPFSDDAADLSTAGAVYRRMKGMLLRGRLLWHLRHYKYVYTTSSRKFLDPKAVWVPLATRAALSIVKERGGRELLFSDLELNSIWHPIRPVPQKSK